MNQLELFEKKITTARSYPANDGFDHNKIVTVEFVVVFLICLNSCNALSAY